jgi:hypothetical protein
MAFFLNLDFLTKTFKIKETIYRIFIYVCLNNSCAVYNKFYIFAVQKSTI